MKHGRANAKRRNPKPLIERVALIEALLLDLTQRVIRLEKPWLQRRVRLSDEVSTRRQAKTK